MNLQKIMNIGIALVSVIGLVFWILIAKDESNDTMISNMIWLGKILVYAATAIALLFSIKNLASHPAKLKMALIALASMAVIVGISYGMSSGHKVVSNTGKLMATASTDKWVGAGLRVVYILAILAVLSIVAGGVKKALNK